MKEVVSADVINSFLTEMTTLGDDIRLIEESFPAITLLMIIK